MYDGDKLLRPQEARDILKPVPEAYTEFRKAKTSNTLTQICRLTGGVLIAWPLGTALAGGDAQWGMAAGGAALILLSFPIDRGFTRHSLKTIDHYNSAAGGSARKVSIHIAPYRAGARLVMRF